MRARISVMKRHGTGVAGLTVGLLLILPVVIPNRTEVDEAGLVRRARVKAAVEAAPSRISEWIGADITVPPAAVKLLHPNAILSRRFKPADGGPAVDLLLVHCTDARDMGGHYPPVCYRAAGWVQEDTSGETLTLTGRALPLRVYRFSRAEGPGVERRMRVLNVFILPDGTLTPEIRDIRKLSERLALSSQGVAQLQIITPIEMRLERALDAARELLEGMPDLLEALGVWKEGDTDG